MATRTFNVLFLCTGNSARSQMAECLLNRLGRGRFRAFSAGSHPTGEVHPLALELLRRRNDDVDGLRSKDWVEFAGEGAPQMDLVITVCDDAAGETCPVWPGQPMTAHWGLADPAAAAGNEAERASAFAEVYRQLERRLETVVGLPMARLDRPSLQRRVRDLGSREPTEDG